MFVWQGMDFQAICKAVLKRNKNIIMTCDDLFTASDVEVRRAVGDNPRGQLTHAQFSWLAKYKELFPNKVMYDLSQNPGVGRGRTSLKNGSAMCMATSSHRLWSPSQLVQQTRGNPGTHASCCTSPSRITCCIHRNMNHQQLRSDQRGRWLIGKELLTALGLPVTGPMAAAARVDPVVVDMLTEANMAKMAGNGMHLPSVGLAMLAAILCTDEVHL